MLKKLLLLFLDFYQQILRPHLVSACCFEPSCSEYTKQAILKYGSIQGILMGIKRLLLCHPFSGKMGHYPLE